MVARARPAGERKRQHRQVPRALERRAAPATDCPACHHPIDDHRDGDGGAGGCAVCRWEADLGLTDTDQACRESFPVPVVAGSARGRGMREPGLREVGRGGAVEPADRIDHDALGLLLTLRAGHNSAMDEPSDEVIVKEVVAHLSSFHDRVDPAVLAQRVRNSLATTFAGARVRAFLPVLIERQLSTELRLAAVA